MMTTELPDQLFSLSALDRLLARVEQKSAAFDAALDAAPDTKPCGMHPGQGRMLNREASWQAAKLVYVCTACEIDEKRQRIAKRIEAAGIPSDVRHATLANFSTVRQGVKTGENRVEPSVFLNKAHAFTRGEIRNLILAGTPGIGKGTLQQQLPSRASVKESQWSGLSVLDCLRTIIALTRPTAQRLS